LDSPRTQRGVLGLPGSSETVLNAMPEVWELAGGGTVVVMELHWDDYEPTAEERAEVEAWIAANDTTGVGSIAVSDEAVIARGDEEHISHSAVRSHHDDLSDALTQVVASLQEGLK
jgi:hypothetical protein